MQDLSLSLNSHSSFQISVSYFVTVILFVGFTVFSKQAKPTKDTLSIPKAEIVWHKNYTCVTSVSAIHKMPCIVLSIIDLLLKLGVTGTISNHRYFSSSISWTSILRYLTDWEGFLAFGIGRLSGYGKCKQLNLNTFVYICQCLCHRSKVNFRLLSVMRITGSFDILRVYDLECLLLTALLAT